MADPTKEEELKKMLQMIVGDIYKDMTGKKLSEFDRKSLVKTEDASKPPILYGAPKIRDYLRSHGADLYDGNTYEQSAKVFYDQSGNMTDSIPDWIKNKGRVLANKDDEASRQRDLVKAFSGWKHISEETVSKIKGIKSEKGLKRAFDNGLLDKDEFDAIMHNSNMFYKQHGEKLYK